MPLNISSGVESDDGGGDKGGDDGSYGEESDWLGVGVATRAT